MRNAAKWFLIAAAQIGAIWCVIQLWRAVGPIVGFPGLAIWVGCCYWWANRLDREAEQHFLEELRRRGWKPPDAAKRAAPPRSRPDRRDIEPTHA
jgi:hypothetical protein